MGWKISIFSAVFWRRLYALITIATLLVMPVVPQASAQTNGQCAKDVSQADCAAIWGNWVNWVLDACNPNNAAALGPSVDTSSCCSTAAGSTTGNTNLGDGENALKVAKFLMSKGYSAAGAAGAVGSFKIESFAVIKPNAQESGKFPLGGWGIAQWTGRPGRRDQIEAWVKKDGLERLLTTEATLAADTSPNLTLSQADNDALLQSELNYLWTELQSGYGELNPLVSQSTDPAQAARDWERIFEGCSPYNGEAGCDVPTRIQYAQEIYPQLQALQGTITVDPAASATTSGASTTAPASTTATCSNNSGGGTVGGTISGDGVLTPPSGGVGANIIYYNQCDPQWTQKGNGYDYCSCACGQTSTAMLLASFKNDKSITPNTVYDGVGDSGSGAGAFDPSNCSGSSVMALVNYIKTQGLQVNLVQGRGNGGLDTAKVFAELQQGHALLAHTSKWVGYVNKHSTSGHYLVIMGADATGQNFYVANPGSSQDQGVAIPASGLSEWLDEAYAVWK